MPRMVAAPEEEGVSSRPRRLRMRSVKTWPLGSPASWIVDGEEGGVGPVGSASTVQTRKRGDGGTIFSSPVMSATWSAPTRAATRL